MVKFLEFTAPVVIEDTLLESFLYLLDYVTYDSRYEEEEKTWKFVYPILTQPRRDIVCSAYERKCSPLINNNPYGHK